MDIKSLTSYMLCSFLGLGFIVIASIFMAEITEKIAELLIPKNSWTTGARLLTPSEYGKFALVSTFAILVVAAIRLFIS